MQNNSENDTETVYQETINTVENVLLELNNSGVFYHFRSLINGENNFFDTKKGYIQDNDESSARAVFDMYLDAINEEAEIIVKDLKKPGLKEAIQKALKPDSIERKVLLSYWGLKEDSPWYKAEQGITSIQTFKNEDFPSGSELFRIVDTLLQEK